MKKGAPEPDISTPEKLRDVLLSASSIGYSIGASGQYVSGELFDKLGMKDKMWGKAHQVMDLIPVAETVAKGENQFGFQAVSEIMPVESAELVGRLPDEVEFITAVSAAIARNSKDPESSKALLVFLTRPEMAKVLRRAWQTTLVCHVTYIAEGFRNLHVSQALRGPGISLQITQAVTQLDGPRCREVPLACAGIG